MIEANREEQGADAVPRGAVVVFFDGVCAFCNGAVRFALRRDRADRIRFAPLQSAYARQALALHGCDADALNTFYLLADAGLPAERVLAKSDGVLALLDVIGGVWKLAVLVRAIPRPLRDRAYDFFARHRYRWFGRYDSCPLPTAEERAKFIASE